MCGIAGFLGANPSLQWDEIARRMTETLVHRGPDDGGVWGDEKAGLALGHRRLSILDLSPLGHQPMTSASGRFVMAFNGEVYNYSEIRRELEASGISGFRGTSDTEVMLAALERWGLDGALARFNGMFAIALWDTRERLLHLCADRLGEKPLYYGYSRGVFLFGSELKALRAHPNFAGEVDRDALALFFRHGYIPSPWSIYRGISKLEPGTYRTVRPDGGISPPATYWSARATAEFGATHPFAGTAKDATTRLDELLTESVRSRMVADVPLGAFLSGGIDSSAIVALMQKSSSRPVRTFTVGFGDQRYNEAAFAAEVAHHLGTDHTELYVTEAEALQVIPKLPRMYDEPFADSSQIPTFLIAQLARSQVTVALSGDGGDELFGGYTRYLWAETVWERFGWMPAALRRLGSEALGLIPGDAWDGLASPLAGVFPILNHRHLGDKMERLSTMLNARDAVGMYRSLVSDWQDDDLLVARASPRPTPLDQDGYSALVDLRQIMMLLDTVTYLPGDILAKVDRASMAVGLESRVPLLDHLVYEFAWTLPLSLKFREGRAKWILRRVLYNYVPERLVERPKTGFAIPLDAWLRGPLRDWAEELLNESRISREGYLKPEPVRRRWREHLSGKHDRSHLLWNVLMFQSWLESQHASN